MKLPFLVVLQIDVSLHLMVPVSHRDSGPTERNIVLVLVLRKTLGTAPLTEPM